MKRSLIILIIIIFIVTGCSAKNTNSHYSESTFANANFLELSYTDLVTHYNDLCDITPSDLDLSDEEKKVLASYKGKTLVFAKTQNEFCYGTIDGIDIGTNTLYISLLSKVFGFKPEYKIYPSFDEAIKSVLEGECDFSLDVFSYQILKQYLDFSTPISNQTYILFGTSFDHLEKDIKILNGCKIGYKRGKSFEDFESKLELLNIDVELISYPSFDDVASAITSNEIDYSIGTESCSTHFHNIGIDSYYLSNVINCPPAFAASKKGKHTEFLGIMSKAIDAQLFDIIDSYKNDIYKKLKVDSLNFTKQELELINSGQSVKMFLPIIQDDLEASGVISLYNFMLVVLQEASNIAGIEVKPVFNHEKNNKKTSIIDGDSTTTSIWYFGEEQEGVVFTEPFIESKIIITGLDDKEAINDFSYFDDKRIGAINNTKISNVLTHYLPKSHIDDDYYSVSQTISALTSGKVDFIPLTELSYLSLNEQGRDYSLINVFETEIYQSIAFAFNDTPEGRLYASIYSKLFSLVDVDYLKSQHLDYYISMENIHDKSNRRILFMVSITLGLSLIIFLLIALAFIDKNRNELAKQARIDFLTGLKNRYSFDLSCKMPLEYDEAVLFIDLDKFKQINDLYGHHFGDLVLTNFAKSLSVFDTEHIYRMSGDEFIVITKNIDLDNVDDYIESIEIAVFDEATKNNVTLSVSVGIIAPGLISSKEHAVIVSDYAMYENKRSGKEKYTYVDKEKYCEIEESYKLESQLLDDLNASKLYCEYQPIIDVNTNKIISIEALTRWNNNGVMIPPTVFLPIAEKLNLTHEIDLNCFNQVKKLYKYLNENGLYDGKCTFSINLSQESLLTICDVLLDDEEIPKNKVQLEVVESVTLNKTTFDKIMCLHSVGYIIAIDDYGSGQSSIPLIESDVFQTIKLDKGLLALKDLNQSLIPNLYEMFNVIGKNVVIEGIETERHFDFIKKTGIDFVQGYYYYKPMAKASIVELLNKK